MAELTVEKLKSQINDIYDSDEYSKRRRDWRRWLKEYEGEWWDESVDPIKSKVFVNLLFSTVETNAPLVTDQKPMWTVLSRHPWQQMIAEELTMLSRSLWDSLGLDRKTYEAVKDSLLFGTGLYKIYYDVDAEDIRVDVIDPSTFVVAPGYSDIWDAPWCGQKVRMPMNWVKLNYPDKAEKVNADEGDEDDDALRPRDETELESEFVTVYEIWMKDPTIEEYIADSQEEGVEPEKKYKPKYPNGRIIIFTDDDVILEDKPSPYNHGHPPYVAVHAYTVPHQFWGMSDAKQIEQLNREMNVRIQQLVQHADKWTGRTLVTSADAGIPVNKLKEALRNKDDDVIVAKQDFTKEMIYEVPIPDLNTSALRIIDLFPQFIEEMTGVTDMTKGTAAKKQRQSASEISVLIESSYTRTRQRVRNHEQSLKRLLTLIIELAQQFYDEPRQYSWKEDNGVQFASFSNNKVDALRRAQPPAVAAGVPEEEMDPEEHQQLADYRRLMEQFVDAEQIYIDFELQIDTNSTLPLDKQSLANLTMNLAKMKILPREAILEVLRFPNKDRYIRMIEEEKKQEAAAKQGGGPSPGGGAPPQRPTPVPGQGG